MDLHKLEHTKKEKKAIRELNKYFSKLFDKKFEIGENAVRRKGPPTTVETIHEWFKLGRESASTLHDEGGTEKI